MRVINTNGGNISVTLRKPSSNGVCDIYVINEEDKTFSTLSNNQGVQIIDISFTTGNDAGDKGGIDFIENTNYLIKVVDNSNQEILHLHKLFVTDQSPQNYNIINS